MRQVNSRSLAEFREVPRFLRGNFGRHRETWQALQNESEKEVQYVRTLQRKVLAVQEDHTPIKSSLIRLPNHPELVLSPIHAGRQL